MSNHSRPTGALARPNHMGGLSGLQIMIRRMGRRESKHTTRAKSDPGWREKQAPPKGKRFQNQSKPKKEEASASKVEGPSGWPSRSLPSAVYTAYASKKRLVQALELRSGKTVGHFRRDLDSGTLLVAATGSQPDSPPPPPLPSLRRPGPAGPRAASGLRVRLGLAADTSAPGLGLADRATPIRAR